MIPGDDILTAAMLSATREIEACTFDFAVIDDDCCKTGTPLHAHRFCELKFDLSRAESEKKCRILLVLPHVMHPFTRGNLILNCDHLSTFAAINYREVGGMLNIPLKGSRENLFNDLMRMLTDIPEEPGFDELREKTLRLLLCDLRLMLTRLRLAGPLPKTPKSLVEQTLFFMERNSHRNSLSISEIAENLGVSQQYLGRCFRSVLGTSPRRKLIGIRLEHAEKLMAQGRYLLREIAQLCGWKNQFYFSRSYREARGCPPDGARKQKEKSAAKIHDTP